MAMLYTELLRLWDEAVKAMDVQDWKGALAKLDDIYEPTARTLFATAAAHLALGQLQPAIQALEQTIIKDERLAVGFFQRAGVLLLANRPEEALADCICAQKHMRENGVIDYRQLGLRYKLYSWQVLYNAAAVHVRMGHWDKARDILLAAAEEKGGARGGTVEAALDSISRREVLAPLLVPVGDVFRPRKEEVEQLKQRDFLGKAKVITSALPNDDFAGFDPLRGQKPGFYEPKVGSGRDSRYMHMKSVYMGRNPEELSVPAGGMVFMFSEADQTGMATVIYDGKKGLLPITMLDPVDPKKAKKSKKKVDSVPNGIPFPPALSPPTRPETSSSPRDGPPSYVSATQSFPPLQYGAPAISPTDSDLPSSSSDDPGSVVVKVHYRYTVALRVPPGTPYDELQQKIAHKLGQSPSQLRLRFKHHGTQALTPLDTTEGLQSLAEVAESGRATLWCQHEDPLANRTILYQMVALYDYTTQGPEDLEFSEGDTIDILSEVNEEWLEGHTAGSIGIFPRCFAYRDGEAAQEAHSATML
ncbi:NADPH oxidase activator 1-like [Alosa alosa]|uniref:NADPH oxidase activator 1-like n=1 Tax=Alosa alosa TaxID=278164 RepID=UPI0020153D1A|nr:NADPH oxidase activator 1-like [Alosa alosa]